VLGRRTALPGGAALVAVMPADLPSHDSLKEVYTWKIPPFLQSLHSTTKNALLSR
jgi:hypothetical protein